MESKIETLKEIGMYIIGTLVLTAPSWLGDDYNLNLLFGI